MKGIIKLTDFINIGYYSKNGKYLTNYIFEIISIEFTKTDSIYNIQITNGRHSVAVNGLNISVITVKAFEIKILDKGYFISFSSLSKLELLQIFFLEIDLYNRKLLTKKQ